MSKETNKQTAEKLFADTAHDVLWANAKGEFFTSENIGALSLKPGQKLEKFERPADAPEDPKVTALNATKTIEAINKVSTLEDLKNFEADERKTVKDAYAKRQSELTAEIKGNGNEDTDQNPQI